MKTARKPFLYSVLAAILVAALAVPALADAVVRIASPYGTTTADPVRSAAAGNIELFGQLYARLLRRDADGNLAQGLAESWEVSQDGTEITLNLRDAKFSDGSTITAQDAAFSLLRVRDHEESAYSAPMQQLEDAAATDDKTLVLKLKSAFSPFLGNLEVFNVGIISKADVEARGEEEAFASNPVTSGPYRVKEWLPGDRMILEANPNYWRSGYPKNDGAELITVAAENTRVSMLLAGEVHAIRDVPWSQVADVTGRDGISMPLESSTVIYMTLMNHTRAPFDDVRVRQAAAHALDVEAIAEAVTFGNAKPANTTLPGALDFHHSDFPGLTYDPDKARALLAEAGAENVSVELMITASPQNEQMAVLMQAQWAAVGITADIQKVDGGVWWDRLVNGNYDASPSWWYNETTDPDLAVRWAICGSCGNRSYYTGYNNDTVNQLVEDGARATDASEREEIYHRMQELSTTEAAQIPLYYPPFANAYSSAISGLMMTPALQWTLEETTVTE